MQRYEPKPWDIRCCDMVRADDGEYVRYDDARAEIERLTKERDLSKNLLRSCIQGNNALRDKAQKAMAERDEALAQVAMAYEAAADHCWNKRDLLADAEKKQVEAGLSGRDYYGRRLEAELLSRSIRALAPADAKAALEAYGREKVREGMRHMLNRLRHEGNINPALTYADAIEWAEYTLADMETLK